MFGSKKTRRSAISVSSASVTWLPCVTAVHPASAAARTDEGLCACTHDRNPTALASPHAAWICSSVIVCVPPSRLLFDANSFTRSAPSALSFCGRTRGSASGVPVFSLIGRIDVSRRGPGRTPRAIAARTSTSSGEPRLCTVVKPAASVVYAFSACTWSPAPASRRGSTRGRPGRNGCRGARACRSGPEGSSRCADRRSPRPRARSSR